MPLLYLHLGSPLFSYSSTLPLTLPSNNVSLWNLFPTIYPSNPQSLYLPLLVTFPLTPSNTYLFCKCVNLPTNSPYVILNSISISSLSHLHSLLSHSLPTLSPTKIVIYFLYCKIPISDIYLNTWKSSLSILLPTLLMWVWSCKLLDDLTVDTTLKAHYRTFCKVNGVTKVI